MRIALPQRRPKVSDVPIETTHAVVDKDDGFDVVVMVRGMKGSATEGLMQAMAQVAPEYSPTLLAWLHLSKTLEKHYGLNLHNAVDSMPASSGSGELCPVCGKVHE